MPPSMTQIEASVKVVLFFSGLHYLNTSIPDPAVCSTRVCSGGAGWVEAAWVTTQLYPGCGCCLVDGELVPDGFSWTVEATTRQTWECCKGKVVMLLGKEPVKG